MSKTISPSLGKTWLRRLRNAASIARQRVLSCLNAQSCYESVGVGAGGDVTKGFDFIAETTMIEYLLKFTTFTLISEEAGTQQIGAEPMGFVIMDPIDGSTNLDRGLQVACISLAFATNPSFEALESAVILELFSGRCFHAMKGQGAYCDDERIQPASPRPIEESLVGVDANFPWIPSTIGEEPFKGPRIRHTRHLGANALELSYVAKGALDGFIDLRGLFRGTDLAAAALILKEAGASLINQDGAPITGECSNQTRFALIAGRDQAFSLELLKLAKNRS